MEKYQHVRAFISAASEYAKHPNETTASVLQRNLGVISVSLDLSIFDPGTSIAVEFYVSLHELMKSLESRTPLIWSTVDVLQNACRNPTARQALIHTYKFTPILARLLEANLTTEKRLRVLKLLQELTYGIKIYWQETYLPYLISILTQWVTQSKEEDIIALSLGVLVNLCYKNLPAIYTLMRTVDIKAFIRLLLGIQNQNVNITVQSSKLLIILEHTNTNISENYILNFVEVTFSSLITAMKNRDVLLVQHIVDFFDTTGQNEHLRTVLFSYANYNKDVKKVLATLESNSDPECVALIMEFLLSLVKLKLPALAPLYPVCVKSAMTWIPVEQVCSKALAFVRMVVVDSRRTRMSSEVLEELDPSVLMLAINSEDDEMQDKNEQRSSEMEIRLAELMQLFQEMAKTPSLKAKVMQCFHEQTMRKLLKPILSCESLAGGDWPDNLIQKPTTNLYIHALALTAELAVGCSNWLRLYSELLEKKQMQMAMALALFTGDEEVKQKVLQLTSTVGFPSECVPAVALCMRELEPLILVQNTNTIAALGNKVSAHCSGNELAPLFSFAQQERLDACLERFNRALESNQLSDITTSAVMELYEYKLAAMRHAERAMQSGLEAANNHATSMQHRLAQVLAESSRFHQILFETQQCLEAMKTEKSVLSAKLLDTENQTEKAIAIKRQEIAGLKKIVQEKSATIDYLNGVLAERKKELETACAIAEKKSAEMQDSLNKKEQIIQAKCAEIESNRKDMSALKQEVQQLTQLLRKYEQTISQKDESIQKLREELTDLNRMRDMIFALTAKKKEDLNTS